MQQEPKRLTIGRAIPHRWSVFRLSNCALHNFIILICILRKDTVKTQWLQIISPNNVIFSVYTGVNTCVCVVCAFVACFTWFIKSNFLCTPVLNNVGTFGVKLLAILESVKAPGYFLVVWCSSKSFVPAVKQWRTRSNVFQLGKVLSLLCLSMELK